MAEYSDHELKGALRRVFVDNGADFIYVENRRERFRLAGIRLGVDRGWLYFDGYRGNDPQSQVLVYRLAPEGEQYFQPREAKNA